MRNLKSFISEEDAMGTLEVILISAVLIGAAIIFKGAIKKLIETLVGLLTEKAKKGI